MIVSRRQLMKSGATLLAGGAFGTVSPPCTIRSSLAAELSSSPLPAAFDSLKPLGDLVKPITAEERRSRVVRAQHLMGQSNPRFNALFVTPGTSFGYFTGVNFGTGERLLALMIPRVGTPLMVCPAFEEGRIRERLELPVEIRTWEEDQNAYRLVSDWLGQHKLRNGRIGVESGVPFESFDRLRAENATADYVSAVPIMAGCRERKTEHELELMRLACGATFDVYKAIFASLHEGVTQTAVMGWCERGYSKMGLEGEAAVLFGPAASFPHGMKGDRALREGDAVLIDGGCIVEGYNSDISRTGILGRASDKIQKAFEMSRKAQDAALAAAVAGRTCESVDRAARTVMTQGGFGPGYKYFSHRLGHGIGLDGHEMPYLVGGNKTILESGMTFSNEPGIYVPGDYGVRCEDLMVIMPDGPANLLTRGFQPSLETPIA